MAGDMQMLKSRTFAPEETDRLIALLAGMQSLSGQFVEKGGNPIGRELRQMIAVRVAIPPGFRAMHALTDPTNILLWTDAYSLAGANDTDGIIPVTKNTAYSIQTKKELRDTILKTSDGRTLFALQTANYGAVGTCIDVTYPLKICGTRLRRICAATVIMYDHVQGSRVLRDGNHLARLHAWLHSLDNYFDVMLHGNNSIGFYYENIACAIKSHVQTDLYVSLNIAEYVIYLRTTDGSFTDDALDAIYRSFITHVMDVICRPMIDLLHRVLDKDDPTLPHALFGLAGGAEYQISPQHALQILHGTMRFYTPSQPTNVYTITNDDNVSAIDEKFYAVYTKIQNDDALGALNEFKSIPKGNIFMF